MKKMRFVIAVENVKPEEEELFVQRFTLLTQELYEETGKETYLDDIIEEEKE
jgi:hypothetical protein